MLTNPVTRPPRWGLAWRLGLSLASITVALGLVSASCIWALVDIHRRLHSVKDEEAHARAIVHLATAVRDQYAHVAHTIILGNDTHLMLFERACERLRALGSRVRAAVRRPEDALAVDDILAASGEIEALFRTAVLPAIREKRHDALPHVHERILETATRAQADAERLSHRAEESMEDLGKHVRATQHGAIAMTMVMHVLALLTSAAVGRYLYRSIAKPIKTLSASAARVGAGDLATVAPVEGPSELRHLADQFNTMVLDLHRHQAQLLETEKLAGLGRFAAGLAHELNNPIAVISGYAKLLRRQPLAPSMDARALAAIDEEADRCQAVIEGLLHLTRGGGVERAPVELRALLEETTDAVRRAARQPAASIEVEGSACIAGDRGKLQLVFANLLRNAVEAAGPAGHVSCAVSSAESVVTVTIKDSGAGVPADIRPRIFEPFFTTKVNGTGLGLSMAKAIMNAHGGDSRYSPTMGAALGSLRPSRRSRRALSRDWQSQDPRGRRQGERALTLARHPRRQT